MMYEREQPQLRELRERVTALETWAGTLADTLGRMLRQPIPHEEVPMPPVPPVCPCGWCNIRLDEVAWP